MAAVGRSNAGYDAFYTLVKDGEASRGFDAHLEIEAHEAVAIAGAIKKVNDDFFNAEEGASNNSDRISSALNDLYSE